MKWFCRCLLLFAVFAVLAILVSCTTKKVLAENLALQVELARTQGGLQVVPSLHKAELQLAYHAGFEAGLAAASPEPPQPEVHQ